MLCSDKHNVFNNYAYKCSKAIAKINDENAEMLTDTGEDLSVINHKFLNKHKSHF